MSTTRAKTWAAHYRAALEQIAGHPRNTIARRQARAAKEAG